MEQVEVRVFSEKTTNLLQPEVEYAVPNSGAVEACME